MKEKGERAVMTQWTVKVNQVKEVGWRNMRKDWSCPLNRWLYTANSVFTKLARTMRRRWQFRTLYRLEDQESDRARRLLARGLALIAEKESVLSK